MNWIEELYTIPVWKKYSQVNEESYLEHILKSVPKVNNFIVELGAWDGYHLSNTRYFIEKGYEALLIDGDNKGNDEVKQHFISKENVIPLLKTYKTPKKFDLFCIDLDGNDLYVLEEVLKAGYKPSVILAEFNPIFDANLSYTIRYNPEHTWNNDDYYGFSFAAGCKMAEKYGYTCIFQNDNLNMYFVEKSLLVYKGMDLTKPLYINVPEVTYSVMHGHAPAVKNDWIIYA